jgi:hypothetical protein
MLGEREREREGERERCEVKVGETRDFLHNHGYDFLMCDIRGEL